MSISAEDRGIPGEWLLTVSVRGRMEVASVADATTVRCIGGVRRASPGLVQLIGDSAPDIAQGLCRR
jgi:hypothetical protein